MASKKKARAGRGPGGASASEFVRSLSSSTPAKDVVAAGAAKGLKFSANLVYAVRRTGKKRGAAKRGPGRPPGRRVGLGRPRGARGGSAASNLEASLRTAIAMLGLERARQILAEVEAAFSR